MKSSTQQKQSNNLYPHFSDKLDTENPSLSEEGLKLLYNELHERSAFQAIKGYHSWLLSFLSVKRRQRILDVGCGSGELLRIAHELGLFTAGVDISNVAIMQAQMKIPNAELQVAQAEALPFPDNYFDFITCTGSLEHVLDIPQAVREISRVAKVDAKILIVVPNNRFIFIIVNHLRQRLFPDKSQPIERFASRKEWQKTLQNNGLDVVYTKKDNNFFLPTALLQLFVKGIGHLIPLEYCYQFIFIAKPYKSS